MSIVKKVIFCHLFFISSINFSLQSIDEYHEDISELVVMYDTNNPEEIYPLEDNDAVAFMSELQNLVDNLELDPSATDTDIHEDVVLDINIQQGVAEITIASDSHETHEAIILPAGPDDIVILDHNNTQQAVEEQEKALQDIQAPTTNDTQIFEDFQHEEEMLVQELFDVADKADAITMNEILEAQNLENALSDATIEIDSIELSPVEEHGIYLGHEQSMSEMSANIATTEVDAVISDDEDIIPVPHDLINSVKKAAKKKKKLEKKERANFFKKAKKQNKKQS